MNDLRLLGVQIIECIAKLIGPARNLSFRKRRSARSQHFRKVLTGDVLHDEKLTVAFVEVIAYAWPCRMMHPRQQSRLAFELFAQLLFRKEGFLEGDSRIQTLVNRLVYRAHAAL